jgi:hypothetical protein
MSMLSKKTLAAIAIVAGLLSIGTFGLLISVLDRETLLILVAAGAFGVIWDRLTPKLARNTRYAIGFTFLAALIFAAAFLPWKVISHTVEPGRAVTLAGDPPRVVTDNTPLKPGEWPTMAWILPTVNKTMITGWNSNTNWKGLSLPNWLVVLAAAGVAVLCWLKATSIWDAPFAVLFAPAALGLLHTLGFALSVEEGSLYEGSTAGGGCRGTFLAFFFILFLLVRQRFFVPPVPTPETGSPAKPAVAAPEPA